MTTAGTLVANVPAFDATSAAGIARDLFGCDGQAVALPSERDQNFLISDDGADRMVLKIANPLERETMLRAQVAALSYVAERVGLVPLPLATRDGEYVARVAAPDGRAHFVWGVRWIDGITLSRVPHRAAPLLEALGGTAGALANALADFDHPAIHREFQWDLAYGRRIVAEHRRGVVDPELGDAIDASVRSFDLYTAPLLDQLPRAAVHGDLNDHNVLVAPAGAVGEWRVSGVLDFGDMVYSYAAADLAIAMAYAALDASDPLESMAHVVRGYARERPLADVELDALFGLAVLRLCVSACLAAEQLAHAPDNLYLGVSQEAIRSILPVLAATPFRVAAALLRDAAGTPASSSSTRVVEWLRSRAGKFAPVIGIDLHDEPSLVLDLSVSSPLLDGDPARNAEPLLTRRIDAAMRDAGVRVAIGRYDEPRLLYDVPAFATSGRITDERRTLHLGIDLFAPAGTPVHAPLAGTVHLFGDNAALLDYGPAIILRHETDAGTEFFTLYGHLSRESLTDLAVGMPVAAGQRIATFGDASVNGGWTPHLHLQIITDLLDLGRDFPGVGRVSQRSAWLSLSPDPNLLIGIPTDGFPRVPRTKGEALDDRRRLIGGNLSIAYRDPLKIVRGWRQYLYDDGGRKYVDAYNNVPHVGHCHPRVVEAAHAQMRVLNTNTRYLSDLLVEYADRLASTLPDPLEVCYFVNSASEANELALRLARAYTGARDTIVLEAAYHGNTTGAIDISPYKHAGPGGTGAPEWVHVAPIADDYRGAHKRGDATAGAKYAAQVGEIIDRLRADGRRLAAFIAETCPSVGGQIVFPSGYLRDVYGYVRAAGGVCIADEVQTGLGRMGTHFWAFEAQRVVPDIVVLGKPLGNGHPIGAVVTTRAIADAFDNGMEFFSTFGGNNVSCAVGLAVLDVLRDERLQEHALRVGEHLLEGLRPLGQKYEIIGDVRGTGLFLGVELVRDRQTLDPAADEASYVANRLREEGVLLGTDGPYHNVVKIRPPMPFDVSDADLLVELFERAIVELSAR